MAGSICVPTIIPLRTPVAGQHKTVIDNETLIELHSDSNGVTIFYTTNGSRPNAYDRLSYEGKNTFKFREPFALLPGKRTIKAMAISHDETRQSNVVTKVFDVDDTGNRNGRISARQEDGLRFVDELKTKNAVKREVNEYALVTHKEACADIQRNKLASTEQMMQDMNVMGTVHKNKNYLNNRHQTAPVNHPAMNSLASKVLPPDNSTQVMRLQRETDFLKCIYCFAPRPADPYMRFCNECGNPIAEMPTNRLPPPEHGQMGTCVYCNSVVPFNLPTCLICESDISPQLEPQGAIRLADSKICVKCGSGNPANLKFCITCQSSLPNMLVNGLSKKMNSTTNALGCSKCGRVNNPDARFCDWCGNKPSTPSGSIICTKCAANNKPYAKYCASCSHHMEAPQRTIIPQSQKTSEKWLHIPATLTPPAKVIAATQTVGLYYPSEREIVKLQQKQETAAQKNLVVTKVTAVSPGRGYWRKQIDHICGHIKAQAQNNTEFRSLISEPRMGKILTTSVHEDNYEISINLSFALRDCVDERPKGTLSSKSLGRNSIANSYNGSIYSTRSSFSKSQKKIKRKKKSVEPKHNSEDSKLLKELGRKGEGRVAEVQQLIDEGADPNIITGDNLPLLHLAVRNLHAEAIPILIQEGATVNKKGPRGNTALHEAMDLGSNGSEVVDALLSCGANIKKKNDKDETPYDLAINKGNNGLANKLTISLGQASLDKMLKQSFKKGQVDHNF